MPPKKGSDGEQISQCIRKLWEFMKRENFPLHVAVGKAAPSQNDVEAIEKDTRQQAKEELDVFKQFIKQLKPWVGKFDEGINVEDDSSEHRKLSALTSEFVKGGLELGADILRLIYRYNYIAQLIIHGWDSETAEHRTWETRSHMRQLLEDILTAIAKFAEIFGGSKRGIPESGLTSPYFKAKWIKQKELRLRDRCKAIEYQGSVAKELSQFDGIAQAHIEAFDSIEDARLEQNLWQRVAASDEFQRMFILLKQEVVHFEQLRELYHDADQRYRVKPMEVDAMYFPMAKKKTEAISTAKATSIAKKYMLQTYHGAVSLEHIKKEMKDHNKDHRIDWFFAPLNVPWTFDMIKESCGPELVAELNIVPLWVLQDASAAFRCGFILNVATCTLHDHALVGLEQLERVYVTLVGKELSLLKNYLNKYIHEGWAYITTTIFFGAFLEIVNAIGSDPVTLRDEDALHEQRNSAIALARGFMLPIDWRETVGSDDRSVVDTLVFNGKQTLGEFIFECQGPNFTTLANPDLLLWMAEAHITQTNQLMERHENLQLVSTPLPDQGFRMRFCMPLTQEKYRDVINQLGNSHRPAWETSSDAEQKELWQRRLYVYCELATQLGLEADGERNENKYENKDQVKELVLKLIRGDATARQEFLDKITARRREGTTKVHVNESQKQRLELSNSMIKNPDVYTAARIVIGIDHVMQHLTLYQAEKIVTNEFSSDEDFELQLFWSTPVPDLVLEEADPRPEKGVKRSREDRGAYAGDVEREERSEGSAYGGSDDGIARKKHMPEEAPKKKMVVQLKKGGSQFSQTSTQELFHETYR